MKRNLKKLGFGLMLFTAAFIFGQESGTSGGNRLYPKVRGVLLIFPLRGSPVKRE
jgi:hypothetical protein